MYEDAESLIRKLSVENELDQPKKLTEFYAKARFRMGPEEFDRHYTDGSNDGGIDFYYSEDSTYFIFQTKFSESPKKTSSAEMIHEINKIRNTLTGSNPNKKAEDFVSEIKTQEENRGAILEILWLTTNIVEESAIKEAQAKIAEWRKAESWSMAVDFVVIDKHSLESVIYDVKHGYVPQTGKKTIRLEKDQWIETDSDETGVNSIVCIANCNDVLNWFKSSNEVDRFLQKNIREFLGENKINRDIQKSYSNAPQWFWYKHNGIVVFADNLVIDSTRSNLILRNPQVVNGGQTLKALFSVFSKSSKSDNGAKILVRAYRLPYEDTETYKRSIEIIAALNSQNKINPSDLRSTDPRQVELERLMKQFSYKYIRKRSKEAKSSSETITMRNLALRYYVCYKNAPNEGVSGETEKLFEEDNKYDQIFNEHAIKSRVSLNHVVTKYLTVWKIDRILQKLKGELKKKLDRELFQYTKWFVLADVYNKLMNWMHARFTLGHQEWIHFIESFRFEKTVTMYSRYAVRRVAMILPQDEEPRSFFKTKEATKRFKVSATKFENLINKDFKIFLERI